MAGFDDPRFLQQVIKGLEARIKTLEKNTLPFSMQQKGPLPGWMRAATIEASTIQSPSASSGQPFMRLQFAGSGAGTSPLLVVSDGTVRRVEVGNLAVNGVSPAQYGMRVNDASGNPIFDSQGLISVMQAVGGTPQFGSDMWTGNTGGYIASPLHGTKVTFTLPRTLRILALTQCEYWMGTTAQFGNLAIMIDGSLPASYTPIDVGGVDGFSKNVAPFIWSASLSAGSHTFDLAAQVITGGDTLSVQTVTFLFQLGS